MIDLHHHLLWGLDDGATGPENSLAMARMAFEDGITHVVCTPHANDRYIYDPQVIFERIDELNRALDREGIPLILGHGSDFHITYENIQQAIATPSRFSINGQGYLLIEIPDYGFPPGLTDIFYQLQLAHLTPILTHPERNPTLQADPARLAEWLRAGVLIQVTAGSVMGRMGKKAEHLAHELLSKRWVHFLATDAHNTTTRPPKLAEARDLVAERYDSEYAHLLCVSNPLAAYNGKPLPQQFEPLDLYESTEKKSWWQRFTSR